MGQHEDRVVKRRIVSPPSLPWRIGRPWSVSTAEHVSPHDARADVLEVLGGDFIVRSGLAAFLRVCLAPASRRDYPVVELLAAFAERVRAALVGTGDVTVERHGN